MSKVFKPRFTAPSASDKNFLRYDKGGHNYCVEIGTTKSVLPNCTGYAWGRFLELIGKFHDLSRGNAEVWWGTNQGRKAFKFGQQPKLGAIVCWKQGVAGNNNDGLGHVAVVEQINADGSIVTSNSAYGDANRRFYLQTLKPPYIYASGFDLQGFIYPPTDYVAGKEEAPEVKPSPKPSVETATDWISEPGYQITLKTNTYERNAPTLENATGRVLRKVGEVIKVDAWKYAEGLVWRRQVNGKVIPTGQKNDGQAWAKLEPVKKDEQPKPKPPVASGRQIGSTVVVNGKLFGNSSASSTGSVIHKNKKATIDKIVDGANAPYHVTAAGISGWGNESLFGGTIVEAPKFKPYKRKLHVGTILLKDDLKSAFAIPIRAARTVTVVEEKNGFGKFVGDLIGATHAWFKL